MGRSKTCQCEYERIKRQDKVTDLVDKSVKVDGGVTVATIIENNVVDEKQSYVGAWAKVMQGKSLEKGEQELFDKVNAEFSNAYTHDTGNTAVLIPETIVAGIWSRANRNVSFVS